MNVPSTTRRDSGGLGSGGSLNRVARRQTTTAVAHLGFLVGVAVVLLVACSTEVVAQTATSSTKAAVVKVVGPRRTKALVKDLVAAMSRATKDGGPAAADTVAVTVNFLRADAPARAVSAMLKGRELLIAEGRLTDRDLGYSRRRWKALAPEEHVLAARVVALTVHRSNPLDSLTVAQLQSIFSGRAKNWKVFGGEAKPIRRYGLLLSNPLSGLFHEKVLAVGRCRTLLRKRNSEEILDSLSSDPRAIAFVDAASAGSSGKAVKLVAIGEAAAAVLPNAQSVKDGSYPLSTTLILYVSPQASPAAQSLVEYILSGRGDAACRKHGYVPVVKLTRTNALASYERLYGPDIRRVRSTADPSDDIALARQLLETMKTTELVAELVAAMGEAAADLGSQAAGGEQVALEALRLLWQKLPERKFEWASRRAALWQRTYEKDKSSATGRHLVEALMMAADLGCTGEQFEAASALWTQALTVAQAAGSLQVFTLKQRQPNFVARCTALSQAAVLAGQMNSEKSSDETVRQTLLWLYVTELNQPDKACKLLRSADSEELKTFLPLAREPLETLDLETTLKIAEWYSRLIEKAGPGGKELMVGRTQDYYRHFFARHDARDDTLGLRASLGMKKVGGIVPPPSGTKRPRVIGVRPWPGLEKHVTRIRDLTDLGLVEVAVANPTTRWLTHREVGSAALVTDLRPLASLTRLSVLELREASNVTDLRPLTKLTGLRRLTLSGSGARDFTVLSGLKKLTALNLSGSEDLADLSPLAALGQTLTSLNLSDCPNLTDLSPLAKLTGLKKLAIYDCPRVPEAALDRLAQLLSNCTIVTDPP
jgi:phosphate transport system substrate-binding protein